MNSQSMKEYLLAHWEDIKQIRKHAPYFALSKDKQLNEVEVVRVFY